MSSWLVSESPPAKATPGASDEEARTAWRAQVREHHPDKLIAEGLPQEFVDTANDQLAKINAAWDTIAKERGLT